MPKYQIYAEVDTMVDASDADAAYEYFMGMWRDGYPVVDGPSFTNWVVSEVDADDFR